MALEDVILAFSISFSTLVISTLLYWVMGDILQYRKEKSLKETHAYYKGLQPLTSKVLRELWPLVLKDNPHLHKYEDFSDEALLEIMLVEVTQLLDVFNSTVYYNPEIRGQLFQNNQYDTVNLIPNYKISFLKKKWLLRGLKNKKKGNLLFNSLVDQSPSPVLFLSEAIMRNPKAIDYSSCDFSYKGNTLQ